MYLPCYFTKKLRGDLIGEGFDINPYDPCVANKTVDGAQLTVCWHVDDLKASHAQSHVVDEFIDWVKSTYGTIGEVKVTRGKILTYLGMILDYSKTGQVIVDMTQYVGYMVKSFPTACLEGKTITSPWNDNLFKVEDGSKRLSSDRSECFHAVTAQGLFLCKRARLDVCPAIAYITTRVTCSTEFDWDKLTKMMKYLKQTTTDRLTLSADDTKKVRWHVDAALRSGVYRQELSCEAKCNK
jgi:hypothetical protein